LKFGDIEELSSQYARSYKLRSGDAEVRWGSLGDGRGRGEL
jgi:hypothetical protein